MFLEGSTFALGQGDQRYHVKQIIADIDGGDDVVAFRFFVREEPYDDAGEWVTGLYEVNHGGLYDVRFSGRHARMRIEAMKDKDWTVGKTRLDVRPGGRR